MRNITDIFAVKDFKFPDGFLCGIAVADHQAGGNIINSDCWHNEQAVLKANPKYEVSGMT